MRNNKLIIEKLVKKTLSDFLLEYSNEKHLPFEEDEFKNKNYLEQYTDWLEDFGKYGTLPPSKLDFWEELKKAIKYILENKLHGRFNKGLNGRNEEEIFNNLKNNFFDKYLSFNEDGNVYVERQIVLDGEFSPEKYDVSASDNEDPMTLYNMLVDKYNHNVGGCWCYREGNAHSYCTQKRGAIITFKGYIRCEDIDFVKTILLNYHYEKEHEIRVKPNAKIELFEVDVNCKYKFPLRGHLIVSATYFGNNSYYHGKYALVDDGFGNHQYMDRQGNIKDKLEADEIAYDIVGDYHEGFAQVENSFEDKWSFIDENGKLIGDGQLWFDDVDDFENGLARVELNDKYSYIDTNGNLLGDGKIWYEYISNFNKYGFAIVDSNGQTTLINREGKLIENGKLWFDEIDFLKNGFARVRLNKKCTFLNNDGKLISNGKLWFDYLDDFEENGLAKVYLDDKESFIDRKGQLIGNGNAWFDEIYYFHYGLAEVKLNNKYSLIDINGQLIGNDQLWFDEIDILMNGFRMVRLNKKFSFIDMYGNLIGNGNAWFDLARTFFNDFAKVYLKNKWSFIDTNGNLIGNGKLWFNYVGDFNKNGFAKVELNEKWYYIDTKGNFYDYESEEPIPSPINENKLSKTVITEDILIKLVKETINNLLKK